MFTCNESNAYAVVDLLAKFWSEENAKIVEDRIRLMVNLDDEQITAALCVVHVLKEFFKHQGEDEEE